MVSLAVVVFTVCCWLCCMVLEYLVSNGTDCSWVVVLESVVDCEYTGVGSKGDFIGGWKCLGLDVHW